MRVLAHPFKSDFVLEPQNIYSRFLSHSKKQIKSKTYSLFSRGKEKKEKVQNLLSSSQVSSYRAESSNSLPWFYPLFFHP